MKRHAIVLYIIAVLAMVVLAGCATTKKAEMKGATMEAALESGGSVTVSLLNKNDIRSSYGFDTKANPFIFPDAFIVPRTSDYIVLRLTIDVPARASIEVAEADAVDEKGTARAALYNRAAFIVEEESLSTQIENQAPRRSVVQWNYLPADRFGAEKGKQAYVLVLGGKHPLPDSLAIQVRLLINGQPQSFDIPLPEGFDR